MSRAIGVRGVCPVRPLWWSVAGMLFRGVLFGAVPLVGLAAMLSKLDLTQTEPVNWNAAYRSQAERSSSYSVRELRVSADNTTAWVTRIPAVVQQIDLRTGEVLATSVISGRYVGDIQMTSPEQGFVVFDDERGTVAHSLRGTTDDQRIESGFVPGLGSMIRCAVNPLCNLIVFSHGAALQVRGIDDSIDSRAIPLSGPVSDLRWSSDGERLLVLLTDGILLIYDAETFAVQQSQPTGILASGRILWSHHGKHAAVFSTSGEFAVWDLVADTVTRIDAHDPSLRIAALSPDGEWIACPDSEDQVWLWSTSRPNERRLLGYSPMLIKAMCFTPDGEGLVLGGMNGRVERWSLIDGAVDWIRDFDAEDLAVPAKREQSPVTPLMKPAPLAQLKSPVSPMIDGNRKGGVVSGS